MHPAHRLRRRVIAVSALAASAAITLAGCSATEPDSTGGSDDVKKTLVISLDSAVDVLDAQQWRTPGAMVTTGGLVEQLIEQDYTAEGPLQRGGESFHNALAESYEYSDDGTVITVTLRDGLTFADGTPLTAEDVVWTFQRGIESDAVYIKVLYPMVGLSAESFAVVDEKTLTITAAFATPLLDKMLSMQPFGILSRATAEANGGDDEWAADWFRQNANPSGAYTVAAYDPTTSITLAPNPAYYDADRIANGGITIQFVSDPSQRALLLQNGEIDLAGGLPLDQVAQLEGTDGLTVISESSNRLEYLGINTAVAPFDDARVRRAIALALPYDTFVDEVMYGYAQPSSGLVPEGMETHSERGDVFAENATDAAALLAEAGVGPFTTTLSFKQSSAVESRAAVYIQSALAEIGITVNIEPLPDAEFTQRTQARDLNLYLNNFLGWGADPFYQMKSLVGTGAGTNFNNYSNEALDALIQTGFETSDAQQRAAISAEAQAIIADEMPLIPVWNPDWTYVARDGVTGLTKDNTEQLRLQYLTAE